MSDLCSVLHSRLSQKSSYSERLLSPLGVINQWTNNIQTGCATHPVSYPVGTGGSFPRCEVATAQS
jgi:hypothetical protein